MLGVRSNWKSHAVVLEARHGAVFDVMLWCMSLRLASDHHRQLWLLSFVLSQQSVCTNDGTSCNGDDRDAMPNC
jgi:hypothetical protein